MVLFKSKLNENFKTQTDILKQHHKESFRSLQLELFEKLAEKDYEINELKKKKSSPPVKSEPNDLLALKGNIASNDTHNGTLSSTLKTNHSLNPSVKSEPNDFLALKGKIASNDALNGSLSTIKLEKPQEAKVSLERIAHEYFVKHNVMRFYYKNKKIFYQIVLFIFKMLLILVYLLKEKL